MTVLDTGKYWWAKLFSALYDASPMALAEKLINQFLSAKSIMDTFLVAKPSRRRAEKFLKDAIRQDHVVNLWRYQTLKGETPKKNRETILSKSCPTEIANLLREEMWGKSITTVTHPPTPHQVIITDTSYLLKDLHSLYNHFTLTFTRANKDPLHLGNIHFQKGPKVPFQGHRTSPGTVAPSVKILENDPACGSILNLIMLYNYTRCASVVENTLTTSNFPQLVEKLLE